MRSGLFLRKIIGGLLLLSSGVIVKADELSLENILPALRGQAVVLNIIARVVEKNEEEVWNAVNSKVTIPGRPIGLKLVGANIVVAMQFTPYLHNDGSCVLVAQGQIWMDIPDQGVYYQTTMQTLSLRFGEQVYFFPLGSPVAPHGADFAGENALIVIQLELHPYSQESEAQTETPPSEAPAPTSTPPSTHPSPADPE
jgi:hypothetical protein